MEDFDYMLIIGIIYIINCIILFLINITLCFIHLRDSLLHTNFFKVIFAQIILETLIIFFLLILIITILASKENKEWHLLFHTILNYCINTDLIYNIIILIYITFHRDQNISDIEDNMKPKNLRDSISFTKHSFKFIHIISLCLGLVHTIIFFLIRDTNDFTVQSWENWFYFFCPIEAKVYTTFIFIPFLILFIMSIPYKFVSMDALKTTNYIHLNHYCINCLICGALGAFMPIMKVVSSNMKNSGFPILLFSSAFFLLYLNCLCLFRFNCFYIDDILKSSGKGFMNKLKLFFNLMFFRVEVPKPNIIDFNSTFIYHSLVYESDFQSLNQRMLSGSIASQT